jgi:hypothetical protein
MRLAVGVVPGCVAAGYQLVQRKTVEGYPHSSRTARGCGGCGADRVLVFKAAAIGYAGVPCKGVVVAHTALPNACIVARDGGDMTLRVNDAMMDVAPAR